MSASSGCTTSDFLLHRNVGNKGHIPIMRRPGVSVKLDTLKNLYCIHCRKETNHVEIRPFGTYTYDDFLREFNLGRFVQGNRIALEDLYSL